MTEQEREVVSELEEQLRHAQDSINDLIEDRNELMDNLQQCRERNDQLEEENLELWTASENDRKELAHRDRMISRA